MAQDKKGNATSHMNLIMEKGSHITGQQVNGTVTLDAAFDLTECGSVWVRVYGVEKTFLIERRSKTYYTGSGKNRRRHVKYYNVNHSSGRTFFETNVCLYQFQGDCIPKGQYSFPFSFTLKSDLPSTFYYDFDYHGKNYASINYTFEAETRSTKNTAYNRLEIMRDFVVNKDASIDAQYSRKETSSEVVTWCCCKQGLCKMVGHFEKSSYFIGDKAVLFVELDNSQCDVRVEELKVELVQNITLRAGGYSVTQQNILETFSAAGVGPKEIRIGVDGSKFELPIKPKGDGNDNIPTCITDYIANSYDLQAVAVVSGCTCCDPYPTCTLGITVTNKEVADAKKANLPLIWNPQVMAPQIIVLDFNMKPMAISPGQIEPDADEMGSENTPNDEEPKMDFNPAAPKEPAKPGQSSAFNVDNSHNIPLMPHKPNQIIPF